MTDHDPQAACAMPGCDRPVVSIAPAIIGYDFPGDGPERFEPITSETVTVRRCAVHPHTGGMDDLVAVAQILWLHRHQRAESAQHADYQLSLAARAAIPALIDLIERLREQANR